MERKALLSVTKKLVNSVERCVDDNLEGYVAVNTGLRLVSEHRAVVREDYQTLKQQSKVALVSGGGSGHEPGHSGCVGPGMLTCAIQGAVFTSPPPANILAGIRLVGRDNPAGVLLIVTNYTGDRLTFGLAQERARAEGILVDMVIVGEDCALTSSDKTAGRRGLCGTVLAYKIAGAMADQGKSLPEIKTTLEKVAAHLGTMGMGLSPCSLPGCGPMFTLAPGEVELGLGIHGEAGVKRLKMKTCHEFIQDMIDHMTSPTSATRLELRSGESLAVMINNLGGTSTLEMNVVAMEVITQLEKRGYSVDRAYIGTFLSSLEMAGMSISLLKLRDNWMDLLDYKTSAPGWNSPLVSVSSNKRKTPPLLKPLPDVKGRHAQEEQEATLSAEAAKLLRGVLDSVCNALVKSEDMLNDLDTGCGDGDCGTTLRQGAQAVQSRLPTLPFTTVGSTVSELAQVVEQSMGGTSGAIYSLFLTAAGRVLRESQALNVKAWSAAVQEGIQAVTKYGLAQPGDRTMLDALYPASKVLDDKATSSIADVAEICSAMQEASRQGAASTASMKAKAGRASYVSDDRVTQMDAGASAVATIFDAINIAVQRTNK